MFPAVRCPEEKGGTLLEVSGEGVVPAYVKPAEDGDGMIVRLHNVTDREADVTVRLPETRIARAFRTNILEENLADLPVSDGEIRLSVEAGRLATIRIRPADPHA
jgi:alpha-mannosidase